MNYTLVSRSSGKPLQSEQNINPPQAYQGIEQPQEEGTLGSIGRNIARTGARAGEAVLGLPGDVAHAAIGAGNYLAPSIIPSVEQINEFSKAHPIIASTIGAPITGPAALPGSSDIRKATKAVTGEYLEPQGEGEEFWDNVVSDFATIFAPELGLAKGAKTIGSVAKTGYSALAKAAVGNAAAEAVKGSGGGPIETALTKFIAMSIPFGASGKIKSSYTNDYKKAEDAVAEYAKTNKLPEVSSSSVVNKMEKAVSGLAAHKDQPIIKALVDGIKQEAGETIDLSRLQQMKQNVNSNYSLNLTAAGKKALNKVNEALKDSISSAGKEVPGFLESWQPAEELFGDYAKATKAWDYVKNTVKNKPVQSVLSSALVAGPAAGLAKASTVATVGAAAYPGYQGYKFLSLLKNSPQGRAIYSDMFKNALLENAAAVNRDANKLEKIMEKESPKYTLVPRK